MRRKQQGFIFITALFVVAGLVLLMVMLVADQHAAVQQVQDGLRARRSEMAARSAVAQAVEVLQNANPNVVTLNDDWAKLGNGGTVGTGATEQFDMGDGFSSFRVQIIDAGSLVDINTAPAAQLQLLPLTQDQIDSLLDWRETSTQPRPDGAKDPYYNGLTQPYNTRLGPLTTVDELLLVKGWTANLLYDPPMNVTSNVTMPMDAAGNPLPLAGMLTVDAGALNTRVDGTARVNLGQRRVNVAVVARLGVNPALAAQIAARAPYTSFRALLALPGIRPRDIQQILNGVTFSGATRIEGKINLNTATQPVLQTLANVTPDIASAIITKQTSGFSQLSDLTTVPAVSGALVPRVADAFTVGSDTWVVRAYGESGGVGTALEAIVRMINKKIQVVTWNRVNTVGLPSWWNWDAQAATTSDAGSSL